MTRKHLIAAGAVLGLAALAAWATLGPRPATVADAPPGAAPAAAPAPAAMRGDIIASVTVPQLSAAETMGETAFNARCAKCHGPNAAGRQGVAPPLVHRIYEPGHHADMAFFMAAENGVRSHHWPFGDMPPVPGITRAEIASIVAYIRALQRANGIE
ncbi:c-type cytochrome [Albidovulum sp.]